MSRRTTAAAFPLPAADYLPYLARDAGDVERVLGAGDPDAPVTGCGDWRLRDLGVHLGSVHRWVTGVLRDGTRAEPEEAAPADADLARWYAESARELLVELRAADPDRPCWNFTGSSQTAGFWSRRQAQETTVHLVDARLAIGGTAWVDPLLAADGVDEVLVGLLPLMQRRVGPVELAGPLLVRSADTGHGWLVTPGEQGVLARAAEPEDSAPSTITADALELLLLLWQRRTVAEAAPGIAGDADVATAFLGAKLTP